MTLSSTGVLQADNAQLAQQANAILSRSCFPCHGPDAETREAELRLDDRAAMLESGVVDWDDLDGSELWLRIMSQDEEAVMPPPGAAPELSTDERQTIRQWLAARAPAHTHWAFVPPRHHVPPSISSELAPTAIDAFLARRRVAHGLTASPPAGRYELVRRVYLDLTGLPPTVQQADRFAADQDPEAYQRLVDQLLQSPAYGQRWATPWLDLARYADTNGYEKDRPRSIWAYRDWVIRALNSDLSFDDFTVAQLAGDMLPNATMEQQTATGFHRNTMLNEEGGIDPLEYRFYAQVDRVATTGTVWMGLTIGCAQCHSHKYDPISHTEFYQLLALLNNADEPDLLLSQPPTSSASIEALRRKTLRQPLANTHTNTKTDADSTDQSTQLAPASFSTWLADQQAQAKQWQVVRPTNLRSNLPLLTLQEDSSVLSSGDFTKRDTFEMVLPLPPTPVTAIRLEALPDDRLPARGPGRAYYEGRKGDFFLSEISFRANGQAVAIESGSRSYGKIAIGSGDAAAKNVWDGDGSTGWSTAHREGERHSLVLNFAEPIEAEKLDVSMLFERHFVAALGRFRFSVSSSTSPAAATNLSEELETILKGEPSDWSQGQRDELQLAYRLQLPQFKQQREQLQKLRRQLSTVPHTLVMQERPVGQGRATHRHHRGEWLQPRERVQPGIPAALAQQHTAQPTTQPADRLQFARWLASAENPLVARVVVNRAWAQLMGHGLVRSDGDFGTQTPPPTHPQLLDWLACDFMEHDWSLKHLHGRIVMSAAYQQSSRVSTDTAQQDPQNLYVTRGPRHRLSGEAIRDLMLCAAGRLVDQVGGPSVRPPQPDSVTKLAYGGAGWTADQGAARFRRSLYTLRKRTAPFAAYMTFDGTSRENCVASRARSNTPLQALTILNDDMYLELARALALRVAGDHAQAEVEARIHAVFRRLLTRPATSEELAVLTEYYHRQLARITDGQVSAAAILGLDGDKQATQTEPNARQRNLAALCLVARVVMNLDETINKQ